MQRGLILIVVGASLLAALTVLLFDRSNKEVEDSSSEARVAQPARIDVAPSVPDQLLESGRSASTTPEHAGNSNIGARALDETGERGRSIAYDHPRIVQNITERQEVLSTLMGFLLTGEQIVVDGEPVEITRATAAKMAVRNSVMIIHDAEGRTEVAVPDRSGRVTLPPPQDGVMARLSGGVFYYILPGEFPVHDEVVALAAQPAGEQASEIPIDGIVALADRALSYRP